jgi:beta-galactosidase
LLALRLTSTDPAALSVGVLPAPASVTSGDVALRGRADGVFRRFAPRTPRPVALKATFESVQPAGSARAIPLGNISQPVAAAPEDADFEKAAVWRVRLPARVNLGADPILRLHYVGDVARVTLDGKLITDDFYNGNAFDIGLRRHAPDILKGDLRVAILPLRNGAPIYLAKEARPVFGSAESVVGLRGVEIIPRFTLQLTAR